MNSQDLIPVSELAAIVQRANSAGGRTESWEVYSEEIPRLIAKYSSADRMKRHARVQQLKAIQPKDWSAYFAYMEDGGDMEYEDWRSHVRSSVKVGQVWEHFKGGKYQVLSVQRPIPGEDGFVFYCPRKDIDVRFPFGGEPLVGRNPNFGDQDDDIKWEFFRIARPGVFVVQGEAKEFWQVFEKQGVPVWFRATTNFLGTTGLDNGNAAIRFELIKDVKQC